MPIIAASTPRKFPVGVSVVSSHHTLIHQVLFTLHYVGSEGEAASNLYYG